MIGRVALFCVVFLALGVAWSSPSPAQTSIIERLQLTSEQQELLKAAKDDVASRHRDEIEDARQKILAVLTPAHRESLAEIQDPLQFRRAMREAGLSDTEKTAVAEVWKSLATLRQTLRKEFIQAAMPILTPEQRQQLRKGRG